MLTEREIKRFRRFVPSRELDQCWEWEGPFTHRNYGNFWFRGSTIRAHRLAYILANNQEIPAGMFVCHSCDNPKCVNPHHLFLGTSQDNVSDCIRKGRRTQVCGSAHGRSKLTEQQIIDIRSSKLPTKELQNLYGVSEGTIYYIVTKRTWKHVQ